MLGNIIRLILILIGGILCQDIIRNESPSDVKRNRTIWAQCPCGTGLTNLTIWSHLHSQNKYRININTVHWIKFQRAAIKIAWKCDQNNHQSTSYMGAQSNQWISILFFNQTNTQLIPKCNKQTGKISINIWDKTEYISSIPFTSHTEGYNCFKIPTLLRTHNNTLIVFAEARTPGCDDFDKTDLVYKRSYDEGKTWSSVFKLVEVTEKDQGECGHALVVGNISPVQLRNNSKLHPGRIIAPYTRNNFKLWMVYSDDDGLTWQGNRQPPNISQTDDRPDCNRNMSYFGFNIDQVKLNHLPDFVRFLRFLCKAQNPYLDSRWYSKLKGPWQFIGVGPSRGIQLKSGRILIPGYKSPIRGLSGVPGALPVSQLYNNFAKGFVLISDDDGQTWRQGHQWPLGQGTNQHQLVQLDDGTVISNSRSLSTGTPQFRLQSVSFTEGQTFSVSQFTQIPQPFSGCQGSTVGGYRGKIFATSPNPARGKSLLQYLVDAMGCKINLNGRERLSLWTSRDNAKTYQFNQIIDPGLSAQTSLQYQNNKLHLLYEQADPLPPSPNSRLLEQTVNKLRVLLPSRFIYRQLPLSSEQS